MLKDLDKITVEGYKSIKQIQDLKLNNLNILIGSNGVGKSNFLQIFQLMSVIYHKGLSEFVFQNGGSDGFLYNGPKVTSEIVIRLDFHSGESYRIELIPTVNESFYLKEYIASEDGLFSSLGPAFAESRLAEHGNDILHSPDFGFYHFYDTTSSSPMRRSEIMEDCKRLRGNGSNIAPFLLGMRNGFPEVYKEIIEAIKLVMPFFDDFLLDVAKMGDSSKVKLSWKQKGSDYPMQPYHFSDGTIRYIGLVTALLQPDPPSVIVIDEPELGLHPAAIQIIAELIASASKKTQLIVATQSPLLINNFCVDDIIVMGRENGASVVNRLNPDSFSEWLEDYALGDLWVRNIIDGGPSYE